MDKYHVYRPLLDLIGKTEGTDKGDGYNETLAYGAYTGGNVSLVTMTLAGVDALQTQMLRHPKNTWNSSAVGRYQIVRTTLRNIKEDLRLKDGYVFDPEMQDRMACFLLGVRGIDEYLEGQMSEDELINQLAREWASLPTTSDKGYYGGQHAAVKATEVRRVLKLVRQRVGTSAPPKAPQPAPSASQDNWFIRLLKAIFGIQSSGTPRPRRRPQFRDRYDR